MFDESEVATVSEEVRRRLPWRSRRLVRSHASLTLAAWIACCLWAFGSSAGAQDSGRAGTSGEKARGSQPSPAKRKVKNSERRPVKKSSEPVGKTQRAQAPAPGADEHRRTPAQPSAAIAPDANVRTEAGTEVKTLEFTGLDIEGQLKSPQMLYFLKRLRAEFEHPRLAHRSFMPELARSTKERDF